jgi:hypothetical protein
MGWRALGEVLLLLGAAIAIGISSTVIVSWLIAR